MRASPLATACLLALCTLPQAVYAEQRSLLRARRTSEATLVITLPASSLLQNNAAEQQELSDAEAEREVVGTSGGVQESAGEVVQDARETSFVDQAGPNKKKKARAKAKAKAMKAKRKAKAKRKLKKRRERQRKAAQARKKKAAVVAVATTTVATTTPMATTTTMMTTVDPAVIARQLKISQDAAKARNLLVGMISRAQVGLLSRLHDISLDLEATDLRAKMDLKAINHSFQAAKNMPIMASNADVDVKKIEVNGGKLKAALPVLAGRAQKHIKLIAELMSQKTQLEKDLLKAKKLPGAKRRVQNNQQTLGAVIPRLEKLEKRVTKLEFRLYDGDLHKLVDDTTSKEVQNVVEDVSRGFGRFLKDASM